MPVLPEKQYCLSEILIKTTYQITISKENTFQSNPLAFGAGFFLNYKGHKFFITADHNVHVFDHQKNERTGIDNFVGIFNNISDKENFSAVTTPVSGFYYFDQFNLAKNNMNAELFDLAVSFMDGVVFEAPFYTDLVYGGNGEILTNFGEHKFQFLDEHIVDPSLSDSYFIYGKIKPELKGLFLHREDTFKNDLKFVNTTGDFILLNTSDEINSIDDWAGLSGSPVLNQNGQCVGVLCSVLQSSKSVFVKPFKKILPFLDVIIFQEKHLK